MAHWDPFEAGNSNTTEPIAIVGQPDTEDRTKPIVSIAHSDASLDDRSVAHERAQAVGRWLEELAKAVSVVEQLALSPESHGLIDDLVLLITEQTAGYTPVLECRTALTKLGPFAPTAKALSGQLDKLIEPFQRGLDSLADQLDPIRELRQRIAIAAKSLQAADDLLERVNHARAATGIDARAIQPAGGCRQSFDELVSAVVSGSLDLPPAIERPKSIAGRS